MKLSTVAASFSLLALGASALPSPGSHHHGHVHHHHQKRAYVTEEVTETVVVYTTVYVDAPEQTSGGQFYDSPSSASNQDYSSAYSDSYSSAYSSSSSSSSSSSTEAAPATSSQYTPPPPAAPTTTSVYVAPAPAYTPPPAPSSSSAAAPAPQPSTPSSGGGGGGQSYSGDVTYYNPAGGYGSCGTLIQDSDPVVALAHGMMGEQSNGNPWCGKKIAITWEGKTFTATIMDKCMGCEGASIDLTQGLFNTVCPDVNGRGHGIQWKVIG